MENRCCKNPNCGEVFEPHTSNQKYCNNINCKKWAIKHQPNYKREIKWEAAKTYEDGLVSIDYKEPLKKIDNGGYGYYGVLKFNSDFSKIQSHLDGRLYDYINSAHVKKYGLTIKQYKDKYGISRTTPLASRTYRDRMKDQYYVNMQKFIKGSQEYKELTKEGKREMPSTKGMRFKKTMEQMNKEGTCPDQLKEKLHTLCKKLHRTPSKRDFIREYGAGVAMMIYRQFGSYNLFVEDAGYKSHNQKYNEKFSREALVKAAIDFYLKFGRTPTSTDMKAGMFPSWSVIKRKFGSMNNLRFEAGIPIVIRKNGFSYEETMDYSRLDS